MSDTKKYLKNASALSVGNGGLPSNAPEQYQSRQRQYMADRNRRFAAKRAYLSSDYVAVKAQGLTDDFFSWTETTARLADIQSDSASSLRKMDDYKNVFFDALNIDYFPLGAKLETMGSVWLSVNPSNLSSVNATSVVERCNATYNSYDEYGNIVSEPICVTNEFMYGNDNATPLNLVLPAGNYKIICQKNKNTQRLSRNSRILLGTKAYHITGFQDFLQEFTGDRDSCRLLTFYVRLEETTQYDDLENGIADGKTVVFAGEIDGPDSVAAGNTYLYTANLTVNGSFSDASQTWAWKTSDEDVASVDSSGKVTVKKTGAFVLTATLTENPTLQATVNVTVAEKPTTPYVAFVGNVPQFIRQYGTVAIKAVFYDATGEETTQPITWSFSGADTKSYTARESEYRVLVTCDHASNTPLVITASCNGYSASISVALNGY